MKKIFINTSAIIIFGIVFLLTTYSSDIALNILIILTVIALLITLCATVFFKGSFKQRFLKGLPFCFILIGIVFIFSYFLVTFLTLWVSKF